MAGVKIVDVQEVDEKLIERAFDEDFQNRKKSILEILKKYGKLEGTVEHPFFSDRVCAEAIISELADEKQCKKSQSK